MATRKSVWILIGILVISAWVLGSAIQAGAETMKCRIANTVTKDEIISVGDEEGHVLGLRITEGLAFFENGEIARMRSHGAYDSIPGKRGQAIGYITLTFEDESTIVYKFQRLRVPGQSGTGSANVTGELTKGTGRFKGIKGTIFGTGKSFPAIKGEAGRSTSDITFTYTLPTK